MCEKPLALNHPEARRMVGVAKRVGRSNMVNDTERSTTSCRLCDGEHIHTASWREVEAPPTVTNYERFISSIRRRANDQPDFARGAEIQQVLDSVFASAKSGRPVTLRRRCIARREPRSGGVDPPVPDHASTARLRNCHTRTNPP
ncbi:MAG TPA: hypothetical protein VGA56_19180 [Opitutaceae bacterium]